MLDTKANRYVCTVYLSVLLVCQIAESVSFVEGVSPRNEWCRSFLSTEQLSTCSMVGSDISSLISCPSD